MKVTDWLGIVSTVQNPWTLAALIAVLVYLHFAKNDRGNISDKELAVVREVAASWLAADATKIEKALTAGLLIEVPNDG
jgi:hypothetical protein